jgi:uncharacterized membrane protein
MGTTSVFLKLLTCGEFYPAGRAVEALGVRVLLPAMLLELLASLEVCTTCRAAKTLWFLSHRLNIIMTIIVCQQTRIRWSAASRPGCNTGSSLAETLAQVCTIRCLAACLLTARLLALWPATRNQRQG